ncbi:MAG: RloB family protein, partial [Sulfuricurvum sp.]|uniref:RloB family protein n=1 Tax=Sulfuricurvum sp. TaxID=2025608 RepID=UPI00356AE0C7
MGFIDRGFTTLLYEEESREPERVIIISCEGTNTEPEYFETIKEKLSDYISVLLEIKIVPKPSNASEPKDVVCNLEQFIIDQYDYKSDYDEMWVIWDREKVEHRKANILKILPECKAKNYNIAITNPLFEFWLLLHVVDISTYDKN